MMAVNRKQSDSTGVIPTLPYPVKKVHREALRMRPGLQRVSGFSPMTHQHKSQRYNSFGARHTLHICKSCLLMHDMKVDKHTHNMGVDTHDFALSEGNI